MKRSNVGTMVALVALLTAGSLVVGAQEPGMMEGALVRVDADPMMLAIQSAEGTEHEFAYTAQTEVTGSAAGVAGLATQIGQQVVVHYEPGTPNQATRIEVSV